MIQLAIFVFAGLCLFQGIRALAGKEPENKKTAPAVAVITLVVGVALLGLGLAFPVVLRLYMGP